MATEKRLIDADDIRNKAIPLEGIEEAWTYSNYRYNPYIRERSTDGSES